MRKEILFRAIGQIDGDLIEEAGQKKSVKKRGWIRYAALAASLVLLVGIARLTDQKLTPDRAKGPSDVQPGGMQDDEIRAGETQVEETQIAETESQNQIEKRPVLDFTMLFDGMGFQGIMAYEMPELGNPWNETDEIETLPVIENHSIYAVSDSRNIRIEKERYDEMLSWTSEVATFFGMEDIKPEEKREYVSISNGEIEIRVDGDMQMRIHFLNEVSFPKEYHATNSATREETYELAEYLIGEYKELFQMKNPQIAIADGDYSFDAVRNCNEIRIYDKGDTAVETLLNYHFEYVKFWISNEGEMSYMDINRRDRTPVLGEYEIISVEEATKLLADGRFDTTYHESEFPGLEYVRDVELVYYMSFIDDYKPYYRFWVEVPAKKRENDLNTYVAYYVPAVETAYLEITFN